MVIGAQLDFPHWAHKLNAGFTPASCSAQPIFAAGFRRGDVVHNAFAYHLTPGGFILESGGHALGCTVIPGGVGNTEQQVEAIAHLNPNGYTGTPDFLKILLDTADKTGKDVSSLKRGLVSGAALASGLCHRRTRRDCV
jgi:phenylacetate-CoA ligase